MSTKLFRKKINANTPTHTLIYHHLGLGDYIIISGGLKYLKHHNSLGPAFCICKHQYLNSVKQLYDDVKEFEIISVEDWREADLVANHWMGDKIFIGFDKLRDYKHFDKDFYRIMNVDFKERWDSFTIKRDFAAEEKLLHDVNLPKKFAFVHDDISRGLVINYKLIKPELPIVRPFLSNSIFDWLSILEKATQIHCICSSFKHLVDSFPQISAELFYHYTYVNNGKPREESITQSRKKWAIV
jgi:hypothetical protein